jgi:predicted TPR repeat methyltransferase
MADHDLDGAYALSTPEDSVAYYRDWAAKYDADFAEGMDYVYPAIVAGVFADLARPGDGPVLDVGAGTGLVGGALAAHGIGPVDGVDISAEMLAVARGKGHYRDLFVGDLTAILPLPDATYGGLVSAGTFTHGHVGAGALDELVRVARPGALCALGINAQVYDEMGFAAKFDDLAPAIDGFRIVERRIYGAGADPAHRDDMTRIAIFRKIG